MAQNEKEEYAKKEVEKETKKEKQQDRTFFEKYGIIFVAFLFLIYLFVWTDGKNLYIGNIPENVTATKLLDLQTFAIISGLLFGMAIVFKYLNKGEKKDETAKYVPFNPEKEIPEIEERFQRRGKRITVWRYTPEPKYGEKSGEPWTIHFHAFEQLATGDFRPLFFALNVLHRTIMSEEPSHVHIEDQENDWSGAPKSDRGVTTRYYQIKPTYIKPTTRNQEEEDEEEEEKKEE
jgi:hypothetical protein